MIYSLNEIDVHCKKAARGCGFDWGHAEEIGKAARWLAAYDLPSANVIINYLDFKDSKSTTLDEISFFDQTGLEPNNDGLLCPIVTGGFLTDSANLKATTEYQFKNLAFPILLLPALALLAEQSKMSVSYNFQENEFEFSNGQLHYNANQDLSHIKTDRASCVFSFTPMSGELARVRGQNVSETDWSRLNQYAYKTYVPATDESRRGAGPSE